MTSVKSASRSLSLILLFWCYIVESDQFEDSMQSSVVNGCFGPTCCHISAENPQRPKIIDDTCYSGPGHDYRGSVHMSERKRPCLNWMRTVATNLSKREMHRYGIGNHSFCRNPEPTENRGPWCYVSHNNYGYCVVDSCLLYPKFDYNEIISPPSCNIHFHRHFDVVFSYNNIVYYISSQRGLKQAEIFAYTDISMKSFATPAQQFLSDAWNLCLRTNDTITFVTVDLDNNLYVYFQFPNVIIRLSNNRTGWVKMQNKIFENCLNLVHATAKQGMSNQETLFRSVFDFRKPNHVILETNGKRFECVWSENKLEIVSEGTAYFQLCDITSTLFVDTNNQTYNIGGKNNRKSPNAGYSPTNKGGNISDVFQAVNAKPGLAGPQLGYNAFTNTSLLRLYDVGKLTPHQAAEFCLRDGPTSKLYKIFDGSQLLSLLEWIGSRNKERSQFFSSYIWVQINSIGAKKAAFCDGWKKTSCCHQLLHSFRQSRENAQISNDKVRQLWVSCKLKVYNMSSTLCPELYCFFTKNTKDNFYDDLQQIPCEIRMQPYPVMSTNISAEDILGISSGQVVSYLDADDASAKLGEIADMLRNSGGDGNLNLGVLINSVEALQPVNYSSVSNSGIKRLITNFVTIVDDISDERRADEWMEIKKKTHESRKIDGQHFVFTTVAPQPPKPDPHNLLFLTENVLQRFVMDTRDTLWSKSDQGLTVTTNNVISVIERTQNSTSSTGANGSNILRNFDLSFNPDQPKDDSTLLIASLFPNIINLISQVNLGKLSHNQAVQNRKFVPSAPVLSTTVMNKGVVTPSTIQFTMAYNASDVPNSKLSEEKYYFNCMYLTQENEWDTGGCSVVSVNVINRSVVCSCNHTTNFAILLQVIPPKLTATDSATLQLISYIGESLSVFCLVITLTIFTAFRHSLKSERMVAHYHLVISLIMFHVVQLFSAKAEEYKNDTSVPCIFVAFVTHFSLLVTFMWMLCEGVTLHLNVINVFHAITKFKIARYFIGWGIPLVISGITLAYGLSQPPYPTCYLQGVGEESCSAANAIGHQAISTDAQPDYQVIEWCWLNTDNYLIWALVIPALIVLFLNTIVLFRVSAVIAQSSKASNKLHVPLSERKDEDFEHIRKSLKGAFVLMPILGIPWVFGFIPQALTHVVLLYIFTVLNSTQGIFILLFYCILNTEVRTVVERCLRKHNVLYRKKSWASQSNFRNSVDLRQVNRNENNDFNQQMGVERSVSVHTSSTYCGGIAPSRGHSLAGSFHEQTSFLPQTTSLCKHNNYIFPDDSCALIRSSSLRNVDPGFENKNNIEIIQCRKTWHSSSFN